MAKSPLHQTRPKPFSFPQARWESTGSTLHSPGRQKNTPQESVNILGVEFDLATHTPASQEGRQGCCLENELHPTRRAHPGRSGGRHTPFKSQVRSLMEYSPLAWSSCPPELRLNPRARPSHSTRAAHNIDHQVTVPFARTEHYLRSFLPRYGRPMEHLGAPDRPAPHHFPARLQIGPREGVSKEATSRFADIGLQQMSVHGEEKRERESEKVRERVRR
ncbi:hypothetical protein GWK47_053030 [Chionoecetes opilio]|uniref:Uncharacterized protein n=1 Tax=Chionoecetes opilio TaxID=41210 RepID=A0A8J4Y8D2_CHIOP|nr:hypothetical protein GWK47_053030 [Chionoecetes opilio]